MDNTHHVHHVSNSSLVPLLIFNISIIVILLYIVLVIRSNRNKRSWPIFRIVSFVLAILFICLPLVGPYSIYSLNKSTFTSHMIGHLLLGMLAPLLFALAAPLTLILRSLPTMYARKLTTFLKSKLFFIITHPIVTALLNIGGLWLLYKTSLFSWMHMYEWVYWFVHIHVFVAGYLFTISIIYIDPIYHRKSMRYRAVVLIVALAGHSILAKYLYAYPPIGISKQQAERGSMLMYYGGDIIDAILIFILCFQWYKANRPKVRDEKGAMFQ